MRIESLTLTRGRIVTAIIAATLVALPAASRAADQPPNVQAVLAQVPAESPAALATLQANLAKLNQDDVVALCDLLIEPGTGDDTAPRMAFSALTFQTGDPARTKQRDIYIAGLCAALAKDRPVAVKRFMVQQLELVGTPAAVPHLAPLLTDDELCLPTAQALLAIGGPEVAPAFRAALPDTTDRNHIAIIDALGLLGDTVSAKAIAADADSEDPAARAAVAAALANLVPATVDAIEAAREHGDSWYEESMALVNALHAADRMASAGDKAAALPIYEALWDAGDEEVHLRCAALAGFVKTLGVEAVDRVVAALTAENAELRAAAANLAVELPGPNVTSAYIERFQTVDAPARVGILDVLRLRGHAAALPTALAALDNEDQNVRLAAVKAAVELGQTESLAALIAYMDTEEAAEHHAAKDALVSMRGDDASKQIAAALPDCPPMVQVVLLDTLADRQAGETVPTLFSAANYSEESVRIAAINAIARLGEAATATRLLDLLNKAATEREREAISQALSATCNRAEDARTRAAPVLAALDPEQPDKYCALLRALGRIGGSAALEALRTAAADERPEVSEAAIRAFGEWPTPQAADTV
ncbi:MAG: HEAT repeat domain-containing protein, partial [Phycisphaerae bacterium]|nr:HEAT repeat domain-containing protein [Phycisphaerae bacterium]